MPVLVAAIATVVSEWLWTPVRLEQGEATLLAVLWTVALIIWPVWLVHTYLIAPRLHAHSPRPAAQWAITPIVMTATAVLLGGTGAP